MLVGAGVSCRCMCKQVCIERLMSLSVKMREGGREGCKDCETPRQSVWHVKEKETCVVS